jgi:hypothetical protein
MMLSDEEKMQDIIEVEENAPIVTISRYGKKL